MLYHIVVEFTQFMINDLVVGAGIRGNGIVVRECLHFLEQGRNMALLFFNIAQRLAQRAHKKITIDLFSAVRAVNLFDIGKDDLFLMAGCSSAAIIPKRPTPCWK